MTVFEVVVAADEADGIGRCGGLPWRLSGDMAHFRRLTTETREPSARNGVLMGRRTWDSIPARFRPLRGRLNVVITRNPGLELPSGVRRCDSFDGALEVAEEAGVETIFVIGGGEIYAAALRHAGCEAVHLTRVSSTFGCDTFLEPLGDAFEREAISEEHVENGITYRFERWGRKHVGSSATDGSNPR